MGFKNIAKCTGKVLAKTALVSGGVACDFVSFIPYAVAKKAGENPERPEKVVGANCCSRWLYDKAKEIKITEEKDSNNENTNKNMTD